MIFRVYFFQSINANAGIADCAVSLQILLNSPFICNPVMSGCWQRRKITHKKKNTYIFVNENRLAQRRRSGLTSGRCSSSISVTTTTVLIFHGFSKSLKTNTGLVPLLGHDRFLRSALLIVVHRNLTIRRYILGNSDKHEKGESH